MLDNCEHLIDAAPRLVDRLLARAARGCACWPPAASRWAAGRDAAARSRRWRCPPASAGADAAGVPVGPAAASTGPPRSGPGFALDEPTVAPWSDLPARWTACRWPSSWPRPGCGRCAAASSPTASTTGSGCSPAAAAPRCRGTRRCARSSTGAGTCSTDAERRAGRAGSRSSPAARRWRRPSAVCARRRLDDADVLTCSPRWSTSRCSWCDRRRRPRYRMLETIRAYGAERLAEAGRGRARPAARTPPTSSTSPNGASRRCARADQLDWLERLLDAEHDNLHAALRWAIGDAGDAATRDAARRRAGLVLVAARPPARRAPDLAGRCCDLPGRQAAPGARRGRTRRALFDGGVRRLARDRAATRPACRRLRAAGWTSWSSRPDGTGPHPDAAADQRAVWRTVGGRGPSGRRRCATASPSDRDLWCAAAAHCVTGRGRPWRARTRRAGSGARRPLGAGEALPPADRPRSATATGSSPTAATIASGSTERRGDSSSDVLGRRCGWPTCGCAAGTSPARPTDLAEREPASAPGGPAPIRSPRPGGRRDRRAAGPTSTGRRRLCTSCRAARRPARASLDVRAAPRPSTRRSAERDRRDRDAAPATSDLREALAQASAPATRRPSAPSGAAGAWPQARRRRAARPPLLGRGATARRSSHDAPDRAEWSRSPRAAHSARGFAEAYAERRDRRQATDAGRTAGGVGSERGPGAGADASGPPAVGPHGQRRRTPRSGRPSRPGSRSAAPATGPPTSSPRTASARW